MKTPSFLELKSLVEYLADELTDSQLQEVMSTEDGLVLAFYRFGKEPRMAYLVFDLDKPYPFLGLFFDNPWPKLKKTKPSALFLNAHAKNHRFKSIKILEDLGRVVFLELEGDCQIEFRLIPKQTNLLIKCKEKSISWYPVKELAQNDMSYTVNNEEDVRSILFMFQQWSIRRGVRGQIDRPSVSPFDKWKRNKIKDLEKKKKALLAIQDQINQFENEEWSQVGEFLKQNGLKGLKPEWSVYIDFDKSVSINMQKCFERAKAAKTKVKGAHERILTLRKEIEALSDLDEAAFEKHLAQMSSKLNKVQTRKVEGRLRKMQIEDSGLTAYIGKSAADNMSLLRKAKPYDIWLHLKDYPSAHAIIHRQKDQKISDSDLFKFGAWLVKEGLSDRQIELGGKFAVVIVECRHVKPIKGDKIGRVTYHNARDVLIAI